MNLPTNRSARVRTAAFFACVAPTLVFAQLNCPSLRESQDEEIVAEAAAVQPPVAPVVTLAFDARVELDGADSGLKLLNRGGVAASETTGAFFTPGERHVQARCPQLSAAVIQLPRATEPLAIDSAFPETLHSAVTGKFRRIEMAGTMAAVGR